MDTSSAELLAVAMDVQGAEVAKPWIEKADATYPALVDQSNLLGNLYHFNFVPLILLFNSEGNLVYGPSGFDIRKQDQRKNLQEWLEDKKVFAKTTDNTKEVLSKQKESRLRFQYGTHLLEGQRVPEALRQFRLALKQDKDNWLIRKQIWAIEHPEKFYQGDVDFQWQKQQIEREESGNAY